MLTVHNVLKSLPWIWVGGLHLLYTSSDFIDLCHSPLSYLLSSLRHLVWLLPCLTAIFITVANDATILCISTSFWCLSHFSPNYWSFFPIFVFYYCEALSWHFCRSIYCNLEILFLSSISQLGASHSLYKVRIVIIFFIILLHICLYWISFGIL